MDEPPLPQPRREYTAGELHAHEVEPDDPLGEARRWIGEAIAAAVPEPTAMTLATVDEAGLPDARVVLLRGLDDRGARWFSNRASPKGRQLAARPVAAAVLYWPQLERQVRMRGPVEHLPDEESDHYFASRPRGSQLAAWASDQSAVVADRATLEARLEAAAERFAGRPQVPRPPHWGGELLRPEVVELWQGRRARLHDRLRWTRVAAGRWRLERLQP